MLDAGQWEKNYFEGKTVLDKYYKEAGEFCADIVVIRIGENIPRDKNEEISCKPYYDEMIKYFSENENAKVIVTDNFWSIPALDEIFLEVIKENNYNYVRIGDLEQDESTMAIGLFEHKGVSIHPGDYGMKCIAERLIEAIDKLI